MSFEESKAFLQSSDGNGVSLYDHLTEVLLRVLEEKPEHPLEAFEDIAREVKLAQKTDQTQSIIDQKPAAMLLDSINAATSTATLSFLKKPPPAEGSDEPAPPANPDGVMRNTLADLAAYAQVGIGLSQDEAFRLVLSMKKLLENNPLKSVRFWGKVTGTEHNYLVVESEFKEGEGKEEPVEPDEPQVEAKPATPPPFRLPGEEAEIEGEPGDEDEAAAAAAAAAAAPAEPAPRDPDEPATPRPQAAEETKEIAKEEREEEHSPNQFTYWVCANAGDAWIRLPEVLPAQILAARLIRYHITGNLDAVVSKGYPFFPGKDAKTPGKERHYLRAQIARISASTILLPKEALQTSEDAPDEPPKVNEDAELHMEELTKLEGWLHRRPELDAVQGRVKPILPPPADDAEPADEEANKIEPNKPLENDKPVREKPKSFPIPAWSLRRDLTVPFAPVLLRSHHWPGSFVIAYGGPKITHACVYFGDGQKYTAAPFTPPPPPEMQEEYPDMAEQRDPTVEDEDEEEDKKKAAAPAADGEAPAEEDA